MKGGFKMDKRQKIKIAITFGLLLLFEFIAIYALYKIGLYVEDNNIVKPWVLGVIGGFLGGTTRGMYALSIRLHCQEKYGSEKDNKEERENDKKCRDIKIEMDYIKVWYLFLLKPFIGAGVGFLFALLLKFGLIPFLISNNDPIKLAFGYVLAGGLAGIFAEDAMNKLQGIFSR
jgi:hypothetical protein